MGRWLAIILLLASTALQARVETHEFDNPEEEARYKQLIEELRCLVCQNQNLADSNAELAQDLRQQTYEMVRAGQSSEAIVDYMVQRYGDFVLYRPPLRPATLLLWVGPFLFLGLAVVLLFGVIRQRAKESTPAISDAERQRAEQLLNPDKGDKSS